MPQDIPAWERHAVQTVAQAFPRYGYKKIALICRCLDEPVPRRRVYRILKEAGLLHRLKARIAERARQEVAKSPQATRCGEPYQLLPKRPNELWHTDVTYIRISGYGWWYAITLIDYYSRCLLALHLTPSYSAFEASHALRQAVHEAEPVHGPLTRPVFLVTDNGPSFIARRFQVTLAGIEIAGLGVSAFRQVRIAYRTPTQLRLLERFHETLKRGGVLAPVRRPGRCAGEVGRVSRTLQRGAAALGLGGGGSARSAGPHPDAVRGVRERLRGKPAVMVPVGRLAG